jgi:ribosome maturation protein Sdo1
MSEKKSRRLLGIEGDADVDFLQVVNAYKAMKKAENGNEKDLKEAFKTLANIVASRPVS